MRSLRLLVLLALLPALAGCGRSSGSPLAVAPATEGVSTGYLLGAELEQALPAPGLEAEAASPLDRELARLAGAPVARNVGADRADNACVRWNDLTRLLAAEARLAPPLFARAYALVSVACADGITAGARGNRPASPDGCIVGAAASEVLLDLFPAQRDAVEAALAEEARLAAGEGPQAVLRGLTLGRIAGRVAVRRAHRDGADTPFTGTMPTGDGTWTGTNPVLPACGSWRTWIVTSGAEFPAAPPYAFGSPEDLADVQAVIDAAAALTPEQVAIVHKWADGSPPAIWNEMLNREIAVRRLGAAEASRAHAFANMAMADAFVTCWASKYLYWVARPNQRIPGFTTVVPTPNFPTYTSGHSTISGAVGEVLAALFPDKASFFRSEADEAARSRLWGGIHFPHDNDEGLAVGRRLGLKVVARLRADQAEHVPVLAARE
jgi:hypothetical protein